MSLSVVLYPQLCPSLRDNDRRILDTSELGWPSSNLENINENQIERSQLHAFLERFQAGATWLQISPSMTFKPTKTS